MLELISFVPTVSYGKVLSVIFSSNMLLHTTTITHYNATKRNVQTRTGNNDDVMFILRMRTFTTIRKHINIIICSYVSINSLF